MKERWREEIEREAREVEWRSEVREKEGCKKCRKTEEIKLQKEEN